MTIQNLYASGVRKGIGLIATGDWTHPLWMKEIEQELEETGEGLLSLKGKKDGPKFLLSTELSCIFSQNGKTRRVHTLVWVPTIASAIKMSQEITKRGGNVLSDGRPIWIYPDAVGRACIFHRSFFAHYTGTHLDTVVFRVWENGGI
jgi:PHP family Zn ribbon phosphoesterase